MKLDSPRNSKTKPVFRSLVFVLSAVFILFGILALKEKVGSDPIEFDSTFKFGVAALGWGVILLIVCIRGKILK